MTSSYSEREATIRNETGADLREAYERGRRDARANRKRHPVAMTFMIIAAVIGLAILALAAVNGSFSGAGVVVDRNLATAAVQAEPAVRGAAAGATEAVRDATTQDRTAPAAPTQ